MALDSEFLDALLLALGRRRKAIRYHLREFSIQREAAEDTEKVTIECKPHGVPRTSIRLLVWPDRWIWFDARRSSKNGWVWQFTCDGRLIGGRSEGDVVTALEESIQAAHLAIDTTDVFDAIWRSLLAQGPRPISHANWEGASFKPLRR